MSILVLSIAQAETAVPPPPPLITMLVPWLFLGIIMGSVLAAISKRKGKNPVLWFFLGFIPLVGFFLAIILASRPDVALLDRIRRLEEQLASTSPKPQGLSRRRSNQTMKLTAPLRPRERCVLKTARVV